MSYWKRTQVPAICERLIGFSVPLDGKILLISYEGIHTLHLGTDITVETDDELAGYDIYEPDSGLARYRGREYSIIGLHGGTPILDAPRDERLQLDTDSETLSVTRDGEVLFSETYENFSGDWAAATFSPDGMYIILGCPYDFDLRIYERVV